MSSTERRRHEEPRVTRIWLPRTMLAVGSLTLGPGLTTMVGGLIAAADASSCRNQQVVRRPHHHRRGRITDRGLSQARCELHWEGAPCRRCIPGAMLTRISGRKRSDVPKRERQLTSPRRSALHLDLILKFRKLVPNNNPPRRQASLRSGNSAFAATQLHTHVRNNLCWSR